jgi:hypothetical protein
MLRRRSSWSARVVGGVGTATIGPTAGDIGIGGTASRIGSDPFLAERPKHNCGRFERFVKMLKAPLSRHQAGDDATKRDGHHSVTLDLHYSVAAAVLCGLVIILGFILRAVAQ